jgi:LysR family hydrogen peroxide-inducible transcriptional activator
MISLIQLEYIVAVDTYRHFVTAAEKCFVTQPTLSMQVKKMEEELGVIIFDRTKQPVETTDIGIRIVEQARVILHESAKIRDIIQDHFDTVSGELKIGIIPSLAPYLLPLFIGSLAKKYPDLEIQVKELITDEVVEELKKGLIDVGIIVTPLKEEGILEKPLFYEGIKIYTNPQHSFIKQMEIDLNEIESPDIWLLSQGHCFRHQVVNLCSYQTEGLQKLPFKYESESIETIKKIVDREGGLALLPELSLADLSEARKKQVKNFKGINPLREVSLVFVRNYAKKQILTVLEEEVKVSVPDKMLDKTRGSIVEWK